MAAQQVIPTAFGKLLEAYKQWYLPQPKLLRAFGMPFALGAATLVLQYGGLPASWNSNILLLCLVVLLPWTLYNQYLDVVAADNVNDVIKERNRWRDMAERFIHLNNVLRELVSIKSGVFLETYALAESSIEDARNSIRDRNSLKHNIDRIVALLHKTLEKYANTLAGQRFRVAYLTPVEGDSHLQLTSWFNSKREKPHTCGGDHSAFVKDGRSLAVYVWRRDKRDPVHIDDLPTYVAERPEDGLFSYTSERQKEYLKAIMCYKVEDPKLHVCLGVICLDSNVVGAFDILGVDYCKQVLDTYAERIVFEHRFSLMKQKLGPYPNVGGVRDDHIRH